MEKSTLKKSDQGFSVPDKSYLLQNAKMFNQQINSRKCRLLIGKCLLYVNNPSKSPYYALTADEQTQLFFGASKLFNCKEYQLRQIVYIFMMELTNAKDTIIMTNLLTKDIASTFDQLFNVKLNTISIKDNDHSPMLCHTSNALKALVKIIDPSLLQAFERYFTTALVDKSSIVASAAITASHQMFQFNADLIRKWYPMILDQFNASDFTAYHALATCILIKSNDVNQLLKLANSNLTGPWSTVQLLKLISRYPQLHPIVLKHLFSKYDMVSLQACSVLVNWICINQVYYMDQLVQQLHYYLNSNLVNQFTALHLLFKLAPYTQLINPLDIEPFISHNNSTISSLSMSILLQIGNEQSIDRLLVQLQSSILIMTDDVKCMLLSSILPMIAKYPSKSNIFIQLFKSILLDQSSFKCKSICVDGLESINNSESIELMCTVMEDCEYPLLNQRLLYLISKRQDVHTIKYIYNRLLLEPSMVRVAAMRALKVLKSDLIDKFKNDFDHPVREVALLDLDCSEQLGDGWSFSPNTGPPKSQKVEVVQVVQQVEEVIHWKQQQQLKSLIPFHHSSSEPQLILDEEYQINCTIHSFTNKIMVFEFNIQDTTDVGIQQCSMDILNSKSIACDVEGSGICYNVLKLDDITIGMINVKLMGIVDGYELGLALDGIHLNVGHYIAPVRCEGGGSTIVETYELALTSIEEGVSTVKELLHLNVDKQDITMNKALMELSGISRDGDKVKVMIRMVLMNVVTVEISCQCENETLRQIVVDAFE